MREVLDQIPLGYFWTGVICFALGMATTWRFARYVERMRDAINHARHHFVRAKDFATFARNNVVGFAVTGATFTAVMGAVGVLAYLRIT